MNGLRIALPAKLALALAILFLVPVLHLAVPAGSALHLSDFFLTLIGKILCYAVVSVR